MSGNATSDGDPDNETDELPNLDDVIDLELEDDREQRWIILYEEDYEDLILDTEDSVAFLVDCNQACELLRLTSKVVGALAPEHAPDEEPIEVMIDRLREVADDR